MFAELQIGLDALALAIGFAFVLWGVRLYRIWIGLIGFAMAGAAGAGVAALTADSLEAMLIGGAAAGLVGALLAWPLHKIFAAFVAAALSGVLGGLAAETWIGGGAGLPVGTVAFLVGGIVALRWFESAVQLAMSFTGAQAVFLAVFAPPGLFSGGPIRIGERLLDVHSQNLPAFLVNTALFMGLGWWIHAGRVRSRKGQASVSDGYGRSIAVRFAGLILLAWLATALLGLRLDWQLSSFELLGMHPLSWPVVTLAAVAVGGLRQPRPEIVVPAPSPPVSWVTPVVFSTVAMPLITAALFVAYGASWDAAGDFYRAFMGGTAGSVATKFGVSLALLPLVMVGAARRAAKQSEPAALADIDTGSTAVGLDQVGVSGEDEPAEPQPDLAPAADPPETTRPDDQRHIG
ncbi:MAG: hypothetical protein L0271_10600 [Gemmatimonadetes bacterium]|nr:hypothetical protein [Gemmatimonadota bacterium]